MPKATKPAFNVQKVATNTLAAASLASALVVGPMADAVETFDAPSFGTSSLVAERVTREGLYREYEVDVGDQVFDDARSTYKSAKETKGKKGTHYLSGCLQEGVQHRNKFDMSLYYSQKHQIYLMSHIVAPTNFKENILP